MINNNIKRVVTSGGVATLWKNFDFEINSLWLRVFCFWEAICNPGRNLPLRAAFSS